MLRHLLLDPEYVLEVLKMMGCAIGPRRGDLSAVTHPASPDRVAVLNLVTPMEGDVIELHLRYLRLAPAEFLTAFERFKGPFTSCAPRSPSLEPYRALC